MCVVLLCCAPCSVVRTVSLLAALCSSGLRRINVKGLWCKKSKGPVLYALQEVCVLEWPNLPAAKNDRYFWEKASKKSKQGYARTRITKTMQGPAKASKSRHKPSQTNIIALDCSCICMDLHDIWHDPRRRRLFKSATKHLSGKKEKIPYCYIGQNIFARTSHDSYVSSFHRRVF